MTPMAEKPVTDLMVAEDMGVWNRVARVGRRCDMPKTVRKVSAWRELNGTAGCLVSLGNRACELFATYHASDDADAIRSE